MPAAYDPFSVDHKSTRDRQIPRPVGVAVRDVEIELAQVDAAHLGWNSELQTVAANDLLPGVAQQQKPSGNAVGANRFRVRMHPG
ncbi:MAG: hypothetical protein R2724_12880 [Bryobacterales bacterium]